MTKPWTDILYHYDLYGSKGCLVQESNTLLVELCEDSPHSVLVLEPEGCSSCSAIFDFMIPAIDNPLQKMTLIWDVSTSLPARGGKAFIRHAIEAPYDSYADFIVSDNSLILPVTSKPEGPLRCLELFAGGFGGWRQALHLLTDFSEQSFQVCAVEIDHQAAFSYAIAHDALMVNGSSKLPNDLLVSTGKDIIIHGDVLSENWLQPVACWSPEIVCLSAPCPPWSNASRGPGLTSQDGQLLSESLGIIKLLRPRLVLIEQVSGFSSHPHFELIMKQIRWCGYVVHWSRLIDAKGICPVSRSRWLALLRRINDDLISPTPFVGWTPKVTTPLEFDAVLPPDMARYDSLKVTDEFRQLASQHEFLPPSLRAKVSPEDVLASRCYSVHQIPPTFMSQYGMQQNLSKDFLREKGLLVHFVLTEEGEIRMWHPLECVFLHGSCKSVFLAADWVTSRLHLGNQICVPHALLLIANALRLIPSRTQAFKLEDMWNHFYDTRLTFKSCFLLYVPQGLLVSDTHVLLADHEKDAIAKFHQNLVHNQLPTGQAWSREGFTCLRAFLDTEIAKGISIVEDVSPVSSFEEHMSCLDTQVQSDRVIDEVDVESTQLFTPLLRGLLKTGGLDLDFWFAATLDFGCLVGVWDGFELDLCNPLPSGYAVVLIPCESRHPTNAPAVLVRVMNQQITLFPATKTDFQSAQEQGWTHLFDVFGKIQDCNCDATQILLTDTTAVCPSMPLQFTAFVLAAFEQSKVVSTWHREDHSLDIHISGQSPAIDALVGFFQQAFWPSTCHRLGIHIAVEGDSSHCIIRFRGTTQHCPLPQIALRTYVAVTLFRCVMNNFEKTGGQKILLKWLGRPLWLGDVDSSCSVAQVLKTLSYVCQVMPGSAPLRVVHNSKCISPEVVVGDCQPSNLREAVVWHIVAGLHGGGPTTTKANHRLQVKNSIAGTLLQAGFELSWVGKAVDQLVDKIGAKNLASVSAMPPGPDRLLSIKNKFGEAAIEVPKVEVKTVSQITNGKARKKVAVPCPSNYRVQPDFFLAEDGSSLSQIFEFRGGLQGIYM